MTNEKLNAIAEKWADDERMHGVFAVEATEVIKSAILEATEELQRILDEHAHDFKQLRDALSCSGSDLPQLLKAIEEPRKDKERLDWLLKLEHRIVSIRTISPAERPGWRWQIEYGGIVTIPKIDGRTAIDSAMESERKK